MGVEQLLQMFPLEDGERTVATVKCESVGEEGEPRVPVEFVLTDRRLLAWHPRSPFALPLCEIDGVGRFEERQFVIIFEGDILLVHETETEEIAEKFARALWRARGRVVFVASQSNWIAGVEAAFSGDERALLLLSEAASLERCNAGVHLLQALASKRAAPEKAAASVLDAVTKAGAGSRFVPRVAATTRLSSLDQHILAERADRNPHKITITLLTLLDGLRRGDRTRVSDAARRLSEAPSDDANDVCHFLGYVCRYGETANALIQAFRTAEPLKGTARLVPTTPQAFQPSALEQLADATGNREPLFVARRISCDWNAQARTESAQQRPPRTVTDASLNDDDAMLALLTAPHFWQANHEAEVVWALLRGGRRHEAFSMVGENPRQWIASQHAMLPSDCPAYWVATLAATELLVLGGDRRSASACLESGFRSLFDTKAKSFDPYGQHASSLFEFYGAIAESDGSRASLFSDRLRSSHACFSWTPSVLESSKLSTAPGRTPNVNGLLRWLGDHQGHTASDQAVAGLHTSLKDAVTANRLRVVIGGETSAGKSSLINALVQDDLLFVTQEEATATPTIVRKGAAYVFRAFKLGGAVDELRFGPVLAADEREECRAFVRDHTFQMSANSRDTVRLEIDAPLEGLPENIEFVDTPGINGRDALTRVAEATIDTAHACVFVLDARNALKSSELKGIQYATTAVPKTIFVVNKMDLVLGDEELDCDTSAPEEVVNRVRDGLRAALQQPEVVVAAVSSLSPERLRQAGASAEAVVYAEASLGLRDALLRMLEGSRERLIADLAGRVSTALTDHLVDAALQQAAAAHEAVARLYQQLPPAPEACRGEITRRVTEAWPAIRREYLEALQQRLKADTDPVFASVDRAADGCKDMEDIQRFVQVTVANTAAELLRIAEDIRTAEWQRLTARVQGVVNDFFAALYQDVTFGSGRRQVPIALKTPLPISSRVNELIAQAVDLNANAKAKQ